MKLYLLFIVIIFSLNAYGQLTSAEQTKVDELFGAWNSNISPGTALGVIRDGKLVYTKGYGVADLEHDIPITDTTVFYIGSVSKQFVTMCILLLEERGKLNLDDPVQKYLPDFPQYSAPLSIRHFIHHTSGVRDNLTLWELAGNNYLDDIDENEIYQLIRRQKSLNFTPGKQHLYSNSCYFMLALIIEKISGESLRAFAQKNIFAPLGMHRTFFGDDNTQIIKNRAFSYEKKGGEFRNQIMRYDLVGSGGLYSTIRDLYLWDQNFYNNRLGKGSQKLITKMHTEGVLNNGTSSGYAYAIQNKRYRGLKAVYHAGAMAGYRSFFLRFPEQKFSVILLSNLGSIPFSKLPYRVADLLLEKHLEPLVVVNSTSAHQNNPKKEQQEVPVQDLKQFVGSFYSEELDVTYDISEKEAQLWCSIKNKKPFALLAKDMDLFGFDGWDFCFARDSNNKVSGYSINAGRVTDLKFTRK